MKISLIIPFYNEQDNVKAIITEVLQVLKSVNYQFEIIAIDDGSDDLTAQYLIELESSKSELKLIQHDKNYGQGTALFSGFQNSTGDVIITLDGDRQNDPEDIKKMLPYLSDYDAVLGIRKNRNDPLSKKVISLAANYIRSKLLDDGVEDTGCALKVIKRKTWDHFLFLKEFYRFIPFFLKINGIKYKTIEVNHRPRTSGKTKYLVLKLYFIPVIIDFLCLLWIKIRSIKNKISTKIIQI